MNGEELIAQVRLAGLPSVVEELPDVFDDFRKILPNKLDVYFDLGEGAKALRFINAILPLPGKWVWQGHFVREEYFLLYIAQEDGDRGIGRMRFKLVEPKKRGRL